MRRSSGYAARGSPRTTRGRALVFEFFGEREDHLLEQRGLRDRTKSAR